MKKLIPIKSIKLRPRKPKVTKPTEIKLIEKPKLNIATSKLKPINSNISTKKSEKKVKYKHKKLELTKTKTGKLKIKTPKASKQKQITQPKIKVKKIKLKKGANGVNVNKINKTVKSELKKFYKKEERKMRAKQKREERRKLYRVLPADDRFEIMINNYMGYLKQISLTGLTERQTIKVLSNIERFESAIRQWRDEVGDQKVAELLNSEIGMSYDRSTFYNDSETTAFIDFLGNALGVQTTFADNDYMPEVYE